MFAKHTLILSLAAAITAPVFAAVSAEEAVGIAEKHAQGRALSFAVKPSAEQSHFAVEVQGANGRTQVLVDADSGAVLPAPATNPPAFSLRQAVAAAEQQGKVLAVRYIDGRGPLHEGRPRRAAKGDKPAEAPSAERQSKDFQPFYLLIIEKDGNISRSALSAADGSVLELPKDRHPPFEGRRGERGERGNPPAAKP